jgi:hypothetical protein
MGKATLAERKAVMDRDPNMRLYGKTQDPRSAHEILLERTTAKLKAQEETELAERAAKTKVKKKTSSSRQSSGEAFIKSMARSLGSAAGSNLGRKLFRGILGSLLK